MKGRSEKLTMAVTAQMAVLAAPSMSSSRRRCVALPAGGFRSREGRFGESFGHGRAWESVETGGSGMVDSNMMVMRKRIQSIRIQESCSGSPGDWAEWE